MRPLPTDQHLLLLVQVQVPLTQEQELADLRGRWVGCRVDDRIILS